MDEPTSAITEREVEHLHRMIRSLRESGVAVIYITHKMDEVFRISDYVTVFRDGKHVATQPASELDRGKLISLMVGRELTHMFPKEDVDVGEVVMAVRGLTRLGTVNDISIRDISFDIRRGEILGLAGLMGAGRTEVLEAIFGVTPIDAGEITIGGKPVRIREPADAIANGLGLLTEDRKQTGIMGVLSVGDNMTVASLDRYSPGGWLQKRRMNAAAQKQREALAIRTPSLAQLIKLLSGGNQQKVLVSRWLLTTPDILMIDEPTRGIDVGAKAEIHRLMSALAKEGKAVLMVSSELPEILGMSDRVLVMHEGRLTGEFSREEVTQEKIMTAATGGIAA
jgi:inositol transport system ATP-binding protein